MRNEEDDHTDSRLMRKKAERIINKKHKNESGEVRDAELNKLVHELQVHQIEL